MIYIVQRWLNKANNQLNLSDYIIFLCNTQYYVMHTSKGFLAYKYHVQKMYTKTFFYIIYILFILFFFCFTIGFYGFYYVFLAFLFDILQEKNIMYAYK